MESIPFQIIISGTFISLFVIIASSNIYFMFVKGASVIPFFGGLFGCIGFIVYPNAHVSYFWWLPLLLDVGCGLIIISLMVDYVISVTSR